MHSPQLENSVWNIAVSDCRPDHLPELWSRRSSHRRFHWSPIMFQRSILQASFLAETVDEARVVHVSFA
jgi:hypothetical protein